MSGFLLQLFFLEAGLRDGEEESALKTILLAVLASGGIGICQNVTSIPTISHCVSRSVRQRFDHEMQEID